MNITIQSIIYTAIILSPMSNTSLTLDLSQSDKIFTIVWENDSSYLSKFHHHVSEDVEETDNSVPQPAVGQRLLVAGARTLTHTHRHRAASGEEDEDVRHKVQCTARYRCQIVL